MPTSPFLQHYHRQKKKTHYTQRFITVILSTLVIQQKLCCHDPLPLTLGPAQIRRSIVHTCTYAHEGVRADKEADVRAEMAQAGYLWRRGTLVRRRQRPLRAARGAPRHHGRFLAARQERRFVQSQQRRRRELNASRLRGGRYDGLYK